LFLEDMQGMLLVCISLAAVSLHFIGCCYFAFHWLIAWYMVLIHVFIETTNCRETRSFSRATWAILVPVRRCRPFECASATLGSSLWLIPSMFPWWCLSPFEWSSPAGPLAWAFQLMPTALMCWS
jgi:hypothetical protein